MKRYWLIPIFALLLCACSLEEEIQTTDNGNVAPLTRGFLQLEVEKNEAAGAERIRTIRLIVFTDLNSGPWAEKNAFFGEQEFAGLTPQGENGASQVKIVLDVARRAGRANDKLVVAVVNEPSSLKAALDAVAAPDDLEAIELQMSTFLAADHLSLLPDTPMPMSGAVWTDNDDIRSCVEQAREHPLPLPVQRAVARVDVYLTTDLAGGVTLLPGSTITLKNTYTKSRFVRHEDKDGRELGRILTVPDGALISKRWTQTSQGLDIPYKTPSGPQTPSSVHLCSFYTPERNCSANKLRLDIGVRIPGDDGLKSGAIILDTADDVNGVAHPVEVVRRNSIYRITATVGANGITAIVNDWSTEEINTEL